MTAANGRYASFASVADWIGRPGSVGSTERDDVVISDLLASCEFEIDRFCGTVFVAKTITDLTVHHRVTMASEILIPYAQSIDTVILDGTTLEGWEPVSSVSVSAEDRGFSSLLRGGNRFWEAGRYTLSGSFGYASPPAEIVQALKEFVEWKYNTRIGVANITSAGDVVTDGGKTYPVSVYTTLRAYKQVTSMVKVV